LSASWANAAGAAARVSTRAAMSRKAILRMIHQFIWTG
jgi:hypothetical protein